MSLPYVVDGETELDSALFNPWIDHMNGLQTGALPIALEGIEGALEAYEPLQNMRAGVVNVLDFNTPNNGIQSASAGIQAALNTGSIYIPDGDYLLTSGLAITVPGTKIEFAPGATIIQGGAFRCFYGQGAIGTKHDLEADIEAGDIEIALPSGGGSSFGIGDLLLIESQSVVYGSTGFSRDIRIVTAISGDTLTIDAPVLYAFTVADEAQYAKVAPLRDVTMIAPRFVNPNPSTNVGHAIRFDAAQNIRILRPVLHDMGGGILLQDVLDSSIERPLVDTLRNGWQVNLSNTGFGYGTMLAGSCSSVLIDALQSRHVRHAFTTLSYSPAPFDTFWGGPRDCIVRDGVSYQAADVSSGGQSHWDTHEFGDNITFDGCQAIGGGNAGFQIRSKGTRVINGVAKGCGSRGLRGDPRGTGLSISGGEYTENADVGVSLGADNSRIDRALVARNARQGVSVGGNDSVISACQIERNGQVGSPYGVHQNGGARLTLQSCVIPYDAASQTVGALNLSATDVAINNVCRGFANDAGAFAGAHGSAVLKGNVTNAGVS